MKKYRLMRNVYNHADTWSEFRILKKTLMGWRIVRSFTISKTCFNGKWLPVDDEEKQAIQKFNEFLEPSILAERSVK